MKKSEMDELQILAASLRRHPTGVYIDVSIELSDLLDTFEVEEEPIEEVRPGVCVAKESTSIFNVAPEVDSEVEKRVDAIVNRCLNKTKTKPLKRKWHKWSELKDKYFSKEKQAEMKEQARKELEEDDQ
jgi:hypothetical protein